MLRSSVGYSPIPSYFSDSRTASSKVIHMSGLAAPPLRGYPVLGSIGIFGCFPFLLTLLLSYFQTTHCAITFNAVGILSNLTCSVVYVIIDIVSFLAAALQTPKFRSRSISLFLGF